MLTFVLPGGGISAGGAAFSKEEGRGQDHILVAELVGGLVLSVCVCWWVGQGERSLWCISHNVKEDFRD